MAEAPAPLGPAAAADVVPALREQAGKVADKSLSSGVDAAQAVGKAAESAAQVLDDALPMLADMSARRRSTPTSSPTACATRRRKSCSLPPCHGAASSRS